MVSRPPTALEARIGHIHQAYAARVEEINDEHERNMARINRTFRRQTATLALVVLGAVGALTLAFHALDLCPRCGQEVASE